MKVKDVWGFIDRAGSLVIPARFEIVEPFSDSFAVAHRDGKPFCIDHSGTTRIVGPFKEVTSFVNGLAAVLLSDQLVACIDHSGKTVFHYLRGTVPDAP